MRGEEHTALVGVFRIGAVDLHEYICALEVHAVPVRGGPGRRGGAVVGDVNVGVASGDVAQAGEDVRADEVIRVRVVWMGASGDLRDVGDIVDKS